MQLAQFCGGSARIFTTASQDAPTDFVLSELRLQATGSTSVAAGGHGLAEDGALRPINQRILLCHRRRLHFGHRHRRIDSSIEPRGGNGHGLSPFDSDRGPRFA